jgi:hypothetical protein
MLSARVLESYALPGETHPRLCINERVQTIDDFAGRNDLSTILGTSVVGPIQDFFEFCRSSSYNPLDVLVSVPKLGRSAAL